MKRKHPISTVASEALRMLGVRIAVARRERRWSLQQLAERVGATPVTMRKVERGDPSVGIGIAFEAAVVLGVPLFHENEERRSLEAAHLEDRLALLPKSIHGPRTIDDDF